MKTYILGLQESDDDEDYEPSTKKQKKDDKYTSKFRKYNNDDYNVNYFKNTLTVAQKNKVIKEIEILSKYCDRKPRLFRLLQNNNMPLDIKKILYNKITSLSEMDPSNSEYMKLNQWIDTVLDLPFKEYTKFPINIKDGINKCSQFLQESKNLLDNSIYGMNNAKLQFMQLLSQWIVNPLSVVSAIALKGPMGTGKTTLLKNGISKILKRELIFIPLGGASDGSYLDGHSYTYEGSTYGKIVESLLKCKTANPIIYFDELDKISLSDKGKEIVDILIHLTDVTQNTEFQDKYLSSVKLDMSKCLFIFSYNDDTNINKILKDRLYVIETNGYNVNDKIEISKKFIIPSIEENLNMKEQFIFNNDTLKYLINNKVNSEQGARNLKRALEDIFTRLNLFKFLNKCDDNKIFNETIIRDISFPCNITNDMVDKILKKSEQDNISKLNMYL